MISKAKINVEILLLILKNKNVPTYTDKLDNIKKNQNSLIKSRRYFPFIACHKFVIKEGITIIVIAVSISRISVNKTRLIVGKPIPTIPLTIPANPKTIKTNKVRCSIL